MRKISLLMLAVAMLFASCTGQGSANSGVEISPEEFKKRIGEGNVILLDVRTSQEVKGGKIAGAINIDIYDSEFDAKTNELDKSKTIMVYCKVGGRSANAMNQLVQKGYTVYNLAGGINAWVARGFEVVK